MANLKAALKSIRQSEKHRLRNTAVISELRTLIKKYKDFLATGKREDAEAFLPTLAKRLDMAATKKIIHRSTASRRKSRFMKQLAVLK